MGRLHNRKSHQDPPNPPHYIPPWIEPVVFQMYNHPYSTSLMMIHIAPFRALRPDPPLAPAVASPPYDVVDRAEAVSLASGNPNSFLRVIRPDLELPAETDPGDIEVHERGRDNLERMIRDGVLVQDRTPGMFLYRLVREGRQQTGLVCCCPIDAYLDQRIKRHELTQQAKEDERTAHLDILEAQTGPVFLTYRDSISVDALVEEDTRQRPINHFVADDGITHTVWAIADPAPYVAAFASLPALYIADGHHRVASAARVGCRRRERTPSPGSDAPHEWFLSVCFPASHLQILPYHRLVLDKGDLADSDMLDRLRALGTLQETNVGQPDRAGVFCFYLGKEQWYRLDMDRRFLDSNDPVGGLDVAVLQRHVLAPIFGIDDPRTDPRMAFVGGSHGTALLQHRVDTGTAATAIALAPTGIDQLLSVADAGLVMPPKSTWFEPKLRSGLFVHRLL